MTTPTPHYPAPAKESIPIPNMDDLSFGELYRIKGSTGIDVLKLGESGDITEVTCAVLWHVISQRPEYQGITFDNVLEWPVNVVKQDESADDDAEDVKETVVEMAEESAAYGGPGAVDGPPFTDRSAPEFGSPEPGA